MRSVAATALAGALVVATLSGCASRGRDAPAASGAASLSTAVAVPIVWTDALQSAKHALYDFAAASFGDRFTFCSRNDANQIVVGLLRPTDADLAALRRYADSLHPGYGADVVTHRSHVSRAEVAAVQTRLESVTRAAGNAAGGATIGVDVEAEVIEVRGPSPALQAIRKVMPRDIGLRVVYRATPAFSVVSLS